MNKCDERKNINTVQRKSESLVVATKQSNVCGAKEWRYPSPNGRNKLGPSAQRVLTPDIKVFKETVLDLSALEWPVGREEIERKFKLNSLMGLVSRPDGLADSYIVMPRDKAAGVDGQTHGEYGADLQSNLTDLSQRIRAGKYKPQPSRRVYIPKADGRKRPLGLPSIEDKLVQDRTRQVLEAVFEHQFLDCSYGFRPGRNCHMALKEMNRIIMQEKTNYVVEFDIKGFFDNVDHAWMMKMLERFICDERFLALIRLFLKAGVMEDGKTHVTEVGTPQGGLISPVLSNVFLHFALDLWFEKSFKKRAVGKVFMIRYADDFVMLCTHKADAERFKEETEERLKKFGLEAEPSKTKQMRFGVNVKPKRGERVFTFLGFGHIISKTIKGFMAHKIFSDGKRMGRKLKDASQKLRKLGCKGNEAMFDFVKRHLKGYMNYYGVSGNFQRLSRYFAQVRRLLFKVMNRRSQRKSMIWEKFEEALSYWDIPNPRIVTSLFYLSKAK